MTRAVALFTWRERDGVSVPGGRGAGEAVVQGPLGCAQPVLLLLRMPEQRMQPETRGKSLPAAPRRTQTCLCLQPAQASAPAVSVAQPGGCCPKSCGAMLRLSPNMLPLSPCLILLDDVFLVMGYCQPGSLSAVSTAGDILSHSLCHVPPCFPPLASHQRGAAGKWAEPDPCAKPGEIKASGAGQLLALQVWSCGWILPPSTEQGGWHAGQSPRAEPGVAAVSTGVCQTCL